MAVVITVVVLLAGCTYVIKKDDGDYKEKDWTSTTYVASTYTNNAKVTNSGITTQASSEELWNKMDEAGNNIQNYLDTPEELEKLMNAEIITQYPHIGKGELDGIIKFKRNKTDGTSTDLKFIEQAEFNQYVEDENENVLDYFTLDDYGNLMIAVIDTKSEELVSNDGININSLDIKEINYGTLSEENKQSDGKYYKKESIINKELINYKSAVQQYTMPFQYLWALLVVGEDKEFVLELADLVENSEIVIEIYDNITKSTDVDVYSYNKETRIDKYVRLNVDDDYGATGYATERYWLSEDSPNANKNYDSNYLASYEKSEEDYNITYTKVTEKNSIMYDVTKADVWIVDYSKEYEYQEGNKEETEENNKTLDNTDYILNEQTSTNSNDDSSLLEDQEAQDFASEIKEFIEENANNTDSIENEVDGNEDEEIEVNVDVEYVELKHYDHKINVNKASTEATISQKYVAGNVINNPKVNNNNNEINFVTLLKKSEYKGLRQELTSEITSWFIEILESNPDTVNMVDLTKYLLYKVTDNDYGVTNYDFKEFSNVNFYNYAGVYGNSLQEKVWFALKELGYSDVSVAGAMGNIHYESGGFNSDAVEKSTGQGIGLVQWSFGRRTALESYAESKGVSWTDEDSQIEFLIAEIAGVGPAVKFATLQMIAATYDGVTYEASAWENAMTVEDATRAFGACFERPKESEYINSIEERIEWAEKYYKEFSGLKKPDGEYTPISEDVVLGTFKSDITGKTFRIFNQMKIDGWRGLCNNAAAITIASGYTTDSNEKLISVANNSARFPLASGIEGTKTFFNRYGLTAEWSTSDNLNYMATLKANLLAKKYAAIHVRSIQYQYPYVGASGKRWCSEKSAMHWVAILGYRCEGGRDKIFVGDPGAGNTGWYDIGEFSLTTNGQFIDSIYYIWEK